MWVTRRATVARRGAMRGGAERGRVSTGASTIPKILQAILDITTTRNSEILSNYNYDVIKRNHFKNSENKLKNLKCEIINILQKKAHIQKEY